MIEIKRETIIELLGSEEDAIKAGIESWRLKRQDLGLEDVGDARMLMIDILDKMVEGYDANEKVRIV